MQCIHLRRSPIHCSPPLPAALPGRPAGTARPPPRGPPPDANTHFDILLTCRPDARRSALGPSSRPGVGGGRGGGHPGGSPARPTGAGGLESLVVDVRSLMGLSFKVGLTDGIDCRAGFELIVLTAPCSIRW